MRVIDRLRELRNQGIKLDLVDRVTMRSRRRELELDDGVEVIFFDLGRRYKSGDEGYTALRRILEKQGVPARRLGDIRTERHAIIGKDGKSYRFSYPAADYEYLRESAS